MVCTHNTLHLAGTEFEYADRCLICDPLPEVILLKDLPIVVDGPGDYLTRNGDRVTIDRIDTASKATFQAKGSKWRMFRGKYRPKDYSIWHVSGRHNGVGPHGLDLVMKIPTSKTYTPDAT